MDFLFPQKKERGVRHWCMSEGRVIAGGTEPWTHVKISHQNSVHSLVFLVVGDVLEILDSTFSYNIGINNYSAK